jgi:uncharacterized coiled-coil DUF342 family protein
MKITLARALTIKNRIVREIRDLMNEASECNVYVAGREPDVSAKTSFDEACELSEKLVQLKAKIEKANTPIREGIFMLGELRGRLSFLKTLNVDTGTYIGGGRGLYGMNRMDTDVEYEASISRSEVNERIKSTQNEIDKLQDELNKYNLTTKIEIDDIDIDEYVE